MEDMQSDEVVQVSGGIVGIWHSSSQQDQQSLADFLGRLGRNPPIYPMPWDPSV